MSFTGFTPAAIEMLTRLPSYDREQFQREGDAYRGELLEPAKAFVGALGPALVEHISSDITFGAKTNQSISPINNDLRFNPDAVPYKDHLLFRFWEGADKRNAPTLFVRVGSDGVGFASGATLNGESLTAFREGVDQDGDRLEKAITRLTRHRDAEVAGQDLKRVPAPYDPDHPRAELLRHKWIQVRWRADPRDALHRAGLVTFCRKQLEAAGDLHRWLVDHAG